MTKKYSNDFKSMIVNITVVERHSTLKTAQQFNPIRILSSIGYLSLMITKKVPPYGDTLYKKCLKS